MDVYKKAFYFQNRGYASFSTTYGTFMKVDHVLPERKSQ